MIMKKLTVLTLLATLATILVVIINPNRAKMAVLGMTSQSSTTQAVEASSSATETVVTNTPLTTTIVTASPGQYTTQDVTKVSVSQNGSFKAVYSDGSTLVTYTDNTYSYKGKDGAEARTYADETYFITTASGSSLTTYENGSYQVNLSDGSHYDTSNSSGLASLQSQYKLPTIDSYNQKVKALVDELNQ